MTRLQDSVVPTGAAELATSPIGLDRVTVVIPAFNEAKTVGVVIRSLRNAGFGRILVVDDGSHDQTASQAEREGAIVVRHCVNVGLGGALGTGVEAAVALGAIIIVTCDADGQHDTQDVVKVVRPVLLGQYSVAIGCRLLNRRNMPLSRRLANGLANFVTFVLYGIWCADTQSGLRAFSCDAARKLSWVSSGMEVSSEIIGSIKLQNLSWCEVPIGTIYTTYSLSKGQSLATGVRTLLSLLFSRVRGYP